MNLNTGLRIIKSRLKKRTEEDKEVERLRKICKSCEYNSLNAEHIVWNKKVLIKLSDFLSWIFGKLEEDNLGNCTICTCSVYYKSEEYQFEECPKDYWHSIYKPNSAQKNKKQWK